MSIFEENIANCIGAGMGDSLGILSFPIKIVPLHSRKLTLMSLFGNDYDYKKRLLFTTTYIEQVKQSHKDCNWN